ncbi:hypothetical protein ACRRTK_022877 [Alexandromys fortis]
MVSSYPFSSDITPYSHSGPYVAVWGALVWPRATLQAGHLDISSSLNLVSPRAPGHSFPHPLPQLSPPDVTAPPIPPTEALAAPGQHQAQGLGLGSADSEEATFPQHSLPDVHVALTDCYRTNPEQFRHLPPILQDHSSSDVMQSRDNQLSVDRPRPVFQTSSCLEFAVGALMLHDLRRGDCPLTVRLTESLSQRKRTLASAAAAGGEHWIPTLVVWTPCDFRALGDFHYKCVHGKGPTEQFVSPEPEVHDVGRSEEDDQFIIACDGIWVATGNEVLCPDLKSLMTLRKFR